MNLFKSRRERENERIFNDPQFMTGVQARWEQSERLYGLARTILDAVAHDPISWNGQDDESVILRPVDDVRFRGFVTGVYRDGKPKAEDEQGLAILPALKIMGEVEGVSINYSRLREVALERDLTEVIHNLSVVAEVLEGSKQDTATSFHMIDGVPQDQALPGRYVAGVPQDTMPDQFLGY